ncbi:hypothetical protein L0668_20010 [Paraglaciecola aquimarina]|uniref:Solute-binding protein family 3/N-terminal domain-containing protein n=1 Tax=Paraglaciecola algarum TaxID=3050085 RepID=A0ABS9DBR6_9ALTE|nr:hypothetical protein [Paraglaciecola sp. G1-23]MCF2950405.1 hypothetical protein [Paraglaciecola sp. G1-23]
MNKLNQYNLLWLLSLIIFIGGGLSFQIQANDIIKLWKPLLNADKRANHKDEVIRRALEVTIPEYGSFSITTVHVDMNPSRALEETISGENINLFISPNSDVWDKGTISIKVPIRQGLLSYRLLLIKKSNLKKFENVNSIEDLKSLKAGLHADWVTTKVFKEQGFGVSVGHNFEGLFQMLQKERFDYFPRAVYEIYDELETRQAMLKDITIEPTIALFLPMETYVHASPNAPRIAKRMGDGLTRLLDSGELKMIFEKYYEKDIARANLSHRKIIKIENNDIKN